MGIKLAICTAIETPVHLKIRDAGTVKEYKFYVTGKRLSAEEARDKLTGDGPQMAATVGEFLTENLTGWRDQRLVVDEDTGAPAPFGPEALAAMLSVAGVAGVIYLAYLRELAASDGAEGRRKN